MEQFKKHLSEIVAEGTMPVNDNNLAEWITFNAIAIFKAEKAKEVLQFLEVFSGVKQSAIIGEFTKTSTYNTSNPIDQIRQQAHNHVIMDCLKYFAGANNENEK